MNMSSAQNDASRATTKARHAKHAATDPALADLAAAVEYLSKAVEAIARNMR